MKKFLLLFLLFAGTVHAQTAIPGLRNPTAGQVPTSNADGTVSWQAAGGKQLITLGVNYSLQNAYGGIAASGVAGSFNTSPDTMKPNHPFPTVLGDSGTLKDLYIREASAVDTTTENGSPGIADTFVVYKNGVATDIQGIVLLNQWTGGDFTHTLVVAAGDRLEYHETSGSYANGVLVCFSIEFDQQ